MGKGIYEACHPSSTATPASPAPFLAHPRKSRPAPCPRLARPPGTRVPQLGGGGTTAPGCPAHPSLGAKEDATGFRGRLREGLGLLLQGQRASHRAICGPSPLQRLGGSTGEAPRPRNREAPLRRKPRTGLEPGPHSSLSGREQETAPPPQPQRTTTQTFFRPLFSSKLGIHGDRAGSLTALRPNPDLVTVPLTAHPPVHPPLRSGLPLGAGSRPRALCPAQTPSQTSSSGGGRGTRGAGEGDQHLLITYRVLNNLRRTLCGGGSLACESLCRPGEGSCGGEV
nr:uncharacterized protein LOC112425264 [Macaca nemestrina]